MKKNGLSRLPASTLVGLVTPMLLAVTTSAQQEPQPRGLPEDWSHRHVVFSNPGTYVQMLDQRISQEKWFNWLALQKDPRYLLQVRKRTRSERITNDVQDGRLGFRAAAVNEKKKEQPPPSGDMIHGDWSNVMGGVSGAGHTRTFPAKFSFTTSSKDCADDFVVYTTSTGGANGSGTFRTRQGTFTGVPAAGGTFTITNTVYAIDQVLTLTADATVNTGLKFAVGGTAPQAATNLAAAIARNGGVVGVTATSASGVVTVSSITHAMTTAQILVAEGLSSFTLTGTDTAGTGTKGQPTIFAVNQLYADNVPNGGCQTSTQAVPATYWSYNTGTGAVADLSPVLSYYDGGQQVAFVQRSSGSIASLVLLKWSSTVSVGTIGAPTTPASVTAANYRSCTAPCMTAIAFNGNPNDTNSAPFVDYSADVVYVGDDVGRVHKFTGVFGGTPTEVTTSPWPVTVSSSNVLSSPIYDFLSGQIFVGSNGTSGSNGNRLHSVNASTGAVANSGAIGNGSTTVNGVRDAPLVDPTAQRVYAFVGADNGATDSLGNSCSGVCNAVYQFSTATTLTGLGTKVIVGLSSSASTLDRALSSGSLDDAYYSSADPANPSGSLYVCGSASGTAQRPTLWKIAIAGNSFAGRTQGPLLVNNSTSDGCSPVTVFDDGTTQSLFVGVTNAGSAIGGGGCVTPASGCVYLYQLPPTTFDTTSQSSTINDNNPRFISVSTSQVLNTTGAETTVTAAQAGAYSGMTITQSAGTNGNPTFTYTLRKNGALQAISCQVSGNGSTTCSDTTHSVTYAAGDTIDVEVQRSSGQNLTATFRVQLGWYLGMAATAGLSATGGTGGIIIDNSVEGGGSQIYYATRTSPGVAMQASQAELQ